MGDPAQGMSVLLHRLYWFGVVGLCTLGSISGGGPSFFGVVGFLYSLE